jgi:predicted nucleotidyltransferase
MTHIHYNLWGEALPPAKLRPISRVTAEKNVAALIERASAINGSDKFLYRVTRIWGFGSFFFSEREWLGDIDVCVEIERIPGYADAHHDEFTNMTLEHADRYGPPSLYDFFSRLAFPERQVMQMLRGRRAHIRFHSIGELERLGAPKKLIFKVSQ